MLMVFPNLYLILSISHISAVDFTIITVMSLTALQSDGRACMSSQLLGWILVRAAAFRRWKKQPLSSGLLGIRCVAHREVCAGLAGTQPLYLDCLLCPEGPGFLPCSWALRAAVGGCECSPCPVRSSQRHQGQGPALCPVICHVLMGLRALELLSH